MTTTKWLPDDTVRRRAMQVRATSGFASRLNRFTDPLFVFPLLSVVILAVIWSSTLNLVRSERFNAQAALAGNTLGLLNTYDSEVVRAVREIDQTLKFLKYVYEIKGATSALTDLKARALLPPDLLFVVSIVNAEGAVVVSTRPKQSTAVIEPAIIQALRTDSLWIGQPHSTGVPGQWTLQFGRRLDTADGAFAGAALLSVDAAYFVSGYDPDQLGKHGVLGFLGTDGVFLARRTGDSISAGDAIDYARLLPGGEQNDPKVSVAPSSWDGVRRYTIAQQLYEYPLAVLVGLSEDEQTAGARSNIRNYLWRAVIGSVLLLIFTGLLGHMSWQLGRARLRENEARHTYALRVEALAYHDGLTALPNRTLFRRLLSQAISQAQRNGKQLAVGFIDLDRFKQINDTLGHEAGDQLLREVASRLKGCLRESDIVARLGGDEFVVLLTELSEEKYAANAAQKILMAIARPFELLGQEFHITASIGISTFPQDGYDEQSLTKNADIAMYQAKEDGKNKYQFYSAQLNANSLERLTLESGLRHALERGEFQLHYQAKRDIRSGLITGMEALLRWQHPDLGLVAPLRFIPVAEETGLIVPIGRWVLKTACLQNVAWQKQGLVHASIAVNLTPRQFFDEHLLRDITSILSGSGMAANMLEVEIHESLLLHNLERTLFVLGSLKKLGVRIAVDDFGIGYSSLATLQRFPLDTVKIDRSCIRDLANLEGDRRLTQAVIAVGKSLSLTVVAQGVENEAQAEFLRRHACDELQGFYVDRPVTARQFTELLRVQAANTALLD